MSGAIYRRGDHLPPRLQAEVLRRYVHRWTIENARQTYGGRCPACAQHTGPGEIVPPGQTTPIPWHVYHAPLTTDLAWLRAHAFAVTRGGELDGRVRHAAPAFFAEGVTA